MCYVSHSSNACAGSQDIDAAAEREAAALEWFERELGQVQPKSRLEELRGAIAERLALGLPLQFPRYPRGASVRAHARIEAAFRTGDYSLLPKRNRRAEITTRSDRRRQAERREQKRRLMLQLELMGESIVSRQEAAALTASGSRTIDSALSRGELSITREKGRVFITAASLANYLRRRVA